MSIPPAIYVDVDDTLVRHASTRPVPITPVIEQVRRLKEMPAWLLKTFHPLAIDDAAVDALLP